MMRWYNPNAPQVGDELPSLTEGPITRSTLNAYADASGDDNPLHLDTEKARQSGLPDVVAHGMLCAAYLARMLTRWAGASAVQRLSVRFVSMMQVGDEVHCEAKVSARFTQAAEQHVELQLLVRNQAGEVRALGSAVVAMEEGCTSQINDSTAR